MRRTRKWAYVSQEATRLAGLGLSVKDIAERLDVERSTVNRWMKAGKLAQPGTDRKPVRTVAKQSQTPEQWAQTVRTAYDLDATDEQLVALAVDALKMSRDLAIGPQARLSAMGQFQKFVKQLRLVTRTPVQSTSTPASAVEEPRRKTFELPKRSGVDPRALLSAVK